MAHTCHWPGCKTEVHATMWGCIAHWRALPDHLRAAISCAYRPGQEITKRPSAEYIEAAHAADDWVRAKQRAAQSPQMGLL